MIRVGLTGGIGSGKSIICKVFSMLGVPVFYADDEAKALYENHKGVRDNMTKLFGRDIYKGQKIDRQMLAEKVFQDRRLLMAVQDIVHPEVAARFEDWCLDHSRRTYIVHEAAILFESGAYRRMDVCITVMAPAEIRLERILERPGMTRDTALRIMESQMPDEEKLQRSQHVIMNDNMHLVLPQVLNIHRTLAGMEGSLPE